MGNNNPPNFNPRMGNHLFNKLRTYAKADLAPSPLAGEGWGEGGVSADKSKAYARFSTLSPALPHQGEGSKTIILRKS